MVTNGMIRRVHMAEAMYVRHHRKVSEHLIEIYSLLGRERERKITGPLQGNGG